MKWNNIQQKLRYFVMAAGILPFLALIGLGSYGLNIVLDEMGELGENLGKAGANFTENLVSYHLKHTLLEMAKSRADFIERETEIIVYNVRIMSNMMTKIASNPDDYKPIQLLDPRRDVVRKFQPYIIYSPDTYQNGMTPEKLPPELHHEIAIAANIGNVLWPISKTFSDYNSSFYVGSRKGYFICISLYPETNGKLEYSNEELYQYDCRQRPWYKVAIDAKGPVFSELYTNIDADGYQLIGCSAPYYDRDGVVV